MGKYQAYSEYQYSGVEWLGDAPKDWSVIPVGRLFWRTKRTNFVEKELLSVYRDYGVIPTSSRDDNNNKPSEDLAPYQLVEPADLVMNKMKAWQGSIAISEFEGIVSPAYFVYQPNKKMFQVAESKYIHYLLRHPMYIAQYMRQSKGIRVNQWDLDPEEFQRIELLLPSKAEQSQIINFLDHETAKIDTLIEQQQQLIQLLKEKRQAVISHAVTKGLNPDAPMKDSGVEWLGEVPAHWEVKPLKFLLSDKKGAVKAGPFGSHLKNSDMEGNDVKVISQKNVISKDFNIGELMISEEKYRELSAFTIERNDILISTRGTIGRAAVYLNDEIAILHPCLIRIQVDLNRVFPKFVELLIEDSGYVLEQILINSNSTTIEVIYSENLINTVVCLPNNLIEQREILNYVIQKKEYFDSSICKAQQAIELMQERRTALISAAVTGKIDVRNWQAPQQ